MAASRDLDALRKTTSLMQFLAEVTDASERDPVRNIVADEHGSPDPLIWLEELPDGVRFTPHSRDDILLRVSPPRSIAEPRPPEHLATWVDTVDLRGFDGPEPSLLELGPSSADPAMRTPPPNSTVRAFGAWLSTWRAWARQQQLTRSQRHLYEQLERAAKLLEQQDDEYEFVLGVGLVQWEAPNGEHIRRHLVTEPVRPRLDRVSAEVTVSLGGGKRRFEDKELFNDQDEFYLPDRGRVARQEVLDSDTALMDESVLALVGKWLGVALDQPFEAHTGRVPTGRPLPQTPVLAAAPALLLRPRSRVLIAEAYRRIAAALQAPGAQVPVALAQLVMDTESGHREAWLNEQGVTSGDLLGGDPLFPLPTNDEQCRVIELLRTETGVVVQGPPGTGKTHTIANLVSALLARGQRVLVTSQKDQALKVLREKIPPELRRLCVLLAGGSKDAARELEQGLDALSEAIASPEADRLPGTIATLSAERHELRSRSALLNNRIRDLRDVENLIHDPVVPGFSTEQYRGTLTEIVREVKRCAPDFDWIPPVAAQAPDGPPLAATELLDLLHLLRTDTPQRRAYGDQQIPERENLPLVGELAEIFVSERRARETAHADTTALTQRLASAGLQQLQALLRITQPVLPALQRLGFGEDGRSDTPAEWIKRATSDSLAGHNRGIWGHLFTVQGEATRLQQQLQNQGVTFVVELPPLRELGLGASRGLLNVGHQLRRHLAQGGKLRKVLPKSAAQKEATGFLNTVRVDGQPPLDLPQLDAALHRLEAEVAAAQLIQMWADVGVAVPAGRITLALSALHDNERALADVAGVTTCRDQLGASLAQAGLSLDLSTVSALVNLVHAIPAALNYVALEEARTQVDALHNTVRHWAAQPQACTELGALVQAVGSRDLDAYKRGIDAIDVARTERAAELRRTALAGALRASHPALFELLQRTVDDGQWTSRLTELPAAWAWSKAEHFVDRWRNADEERRLLTEFDQAEMRIHQVTGQLAAAQAMHACLDRMSDNHARALRGYREHMSHVGAGSGAKAREYRKAARAAMHKAKDAVPAWVVPLPNLLDNIAAERDSFDVVIVDEASQVGLEHLFLLWMAPRVIVVGDDKQCTPGGNRLGRLEELFSSMNEHLREIDPEIRLNFTSKSNLYGVLSARSGKDAVVRLREHFRCMPEIINWSSRQFYGGQDRGGLIPLRERTARDLEPLRVVHVEDAYEEGKDTKRRNPVEAKRIVAQLLDCLADEHYRDKTFGVVVLQGSGQIALLDHEINSAISPEVREARGIRVGSPPNFQGDERHVIFLSTVVTQAPRSQSATSWQQSYNVAASRAKDQMWLFTSVRPADYKKEDLRFSLASYMLDPPSVFGESPGLEVVSPTQACTPFDSLFEQRVFREIKQRGYHVVPQYKVGTRSLDLVVVGDGGRLAVECDGHYWHTSPTQQTSDARRDRELHRMGWEVSRIRESEYEFNPDRELAPLWQRLEERGIHPDPAFTAATGGWAPVELPEEPEQTGAHQ